MDLSDFRHCLSALGPDLSAWPDRDGAVELLAHSDEAVALLAAAGIDEPADEALTDAVLKAVRDDRP